MNTAKTQVTKRRWPATVPWWNVLVGIWLAMSPLFIAFSRPSIRWNDVAVGIAIAVLALLNFRGFMRGLPVILGVWLYASTFLLGVLSPAVLWNNLAVTLVAMVGGLMAEAMETLRQHRDPALH